ncbi:phospholipase D-like domain-containing protein [Vibrio sp. St2]|uniref:phospholipase D-like domain-containing protein n=1 Tax=Vibrio sp. St2 TaxID=2853441 RepID=UPI00248F3C33|nr:phospholipase D-like domain-containing protein [Vibrio sp. St2]
MNKAQGNRTYLAKDVYLKWKKRVAKADQSITIYTPFFDKLLVNLLKQTELDKMHVTIVTDLNPTSILEQPKQLKTLKHLLSEGFNVLNAPRLHAKVLLTDDAYITLGSQNFTSYARKSKECTAIPAASLDNTKFVKTLLEWREEAEPIDEAFVDLLLSELSSQFKQYKKLLKNTETQFAHLHTQHEEQKRRSLFRRLEAIEKQSSIKLAQGEAYASVDIMFNGSSHYYSLVTKPGYDLTHWKVHKPGEGTKPYDFKRLHMYPFIVADSGAMGFARIAKTRITYFRKTVTWVDNLLKVGDKQLVVTISFPKKDTHKHNVKVTLKHSYLGGCDAFFLFTGDAFELVEKHFTEQNNDKQKAFKADLEAKIFSNQDALNAFFGRSFTSFTYQELDIGNKNIRDYLKGSRYRLSVIEYQGNPILVIK